MSHRLPFTSPLPVGTEMEFITDAIARQKLSGDGHYTALCERWLEARLGAPRAMLMHSCTAALEAMFLLLDLQPGDEVILPSFTFTSTANAVVLRGGVPVFVDIDPTTLNLDVGKIESAITSKTRAVIAVHYAGRVPDMEAINALGRRHGLVVLEDAAQSLGSTHRGAPAGTHSALSAISFHDTKNVIAGEAGALVINDKTYIERAEILREKGTNRRAFLDGLTDKYTWIDVGSSLLPSEITAAFLYGQLLETDGINARRRQIWQSYHAGLQRLQDKGVGLPPQAVGNDTLNGHLFHLILPRAQMRSEFLRRMADKNVQCTFHYVPLHSAPAGLRFGRAPDGCPLTEDFAARLVRLPLHGRLTDDDLVRIINATVSVLEEMNA